MDLNHIIENCFDFRIFNLKNAIRYEYMFSWWFVKAATKKQSTHSGNHNHVSNKYTSSQKNGSHYLITFDYQQSIIFKSRQKKQTLFHPFTNVVVNERTLGVPGGSVRGERANLTRLFIGCIEAKLCKKICIGISYLLESSRRDLHNALLWTVLESTIENWGKKNLAKTTPKRWKLWHFCQCL